MPKKLPNPETTYDRFLEDTIRAYKTCILWASTDQDGNPLDDDYCIEDFDENCHLKIVSDCEEFLDLVIESISAQDFERLDASQFGHDFFLTRNSHGTGYWDRDDLKDGNLGKRLTTLCDKFKNFDVYANGDVVSCD